MSLSPTNILAKLEELKKWQEKQQERLLEQHNKRLEQNNFTPAERDYLKKSLGVDIASEQNNVNRKASPPKAPAKPIQAQRTRSDEDKTFPKPKQKFLSKGTGLARFRMTPGEQFKPFTKVNTRRSSSESRNTIKTITPLKRPDLTVKPKASWHTVLNSEIQALSVEAEIPPHVNVQVQPQVVKSANDTNPNASLLIFETLEQRAMQSSFCSTNSSIVRLLSSTPHKKAPLNSNDSEHKTYVDQFQAERSVQQVYGTDGAQFETVYAQYNHELGDHSRETVLQPHEVDAYERKLQNEYLTLIEKAIKIKNYVAGDAASYSSSSSVTTDDLEEDTLQTETNFQDDKKWSDLGTCESSSSSEHTMSWQKRDAHTMTDDVIDDDKELVESKLKALELELRTVRAEGVAANKLKSQLDQQRREFEKCKKELVKQMEEEKVQISFALEEERKKLAKEKMVFERYVKDAQSKPSKKERDELAALKIEIAALKETLKLKETRSGTAQARLRNQIKCLEKDNAALKADIEKLNRENGRLLASQKLSRGPSDTKMLHEINRNLTRLTQEQLGKRSASVGKAECSSEDDDGEAPHRKVNSNRNVSKRKPNTKNRTSESNGKENERNVSDANGVDFIEDMYEQMFTARDYEVPRRLSNQEETKKNDRTEITLGDGTKQITYTNGNVKTISSGGDRIVYKYANGDVKETNLLQGTITYRYDESRVTHTTNADGTELIEFPDGQTEKRLKGGRCEVQYPNGVVRRTQSDGIEEVCYPDGTTVTVNMQGERILLLPNGQKEVHTKDHKRREYPDGTVKILYPDGLQETRYANGRIRLKDKQGKLLMDSQDSEVLD